MIHYDRFVLDNGLRCLVHRDEATPMVSMNVMYDVGSKDEDPDHTGFAHLFEHLMFGGSLNIPNYDEHLEKVGGDNNAFTSTDITNYFLNVPYNNLETAFWLESDRMLSLAFTEESLEVQKNVVTEEFKQTHLNQPYGDVMLELRPLAYQKHPYQWPTIGKKIEHISGSTLADVKDFFYRHYNPQNAILSVAGNVTREEVERLARKWFGPIPPRERPVRDYPAEPAQTEPREKTIERDVPYDAIYKAYHIEGRGDPGFYPADLCSDILSRGRSARLYQELVKAEQLFVDIEAYVTGELDPGLLIVEGKLRPGVEHQQANEAIQRELGRLRDGDLSEEELEKVKNKVETTLTLAETKALYKGMNLAFGEIFGDPSRVNKETKQYRAVTLDDIQKKAREKFVESNCSTLYYKGKG